MDLNASVGDYAHPAGDREFINSLVDYFRQEFGWEVSAGNIALTIAAKPPFSFSSHACRHISKWSIQKILLPLAPDYIGYQDAGIDDDIFISYKPQIEELGEKLFKYRVDLTPCKSTAPSEPSAFSPHQPHWQCANRKGNRAVEPIGAKPQHPADHRQRLWHALPRHNFPRSGAKLGTTYSDVYEFVEIGLPGTRTGIVVAHQKIIQGIAGMNAVISLSPNNLGAALVNDLIKTGEIDASAASSSNPIIGRRWNRRSGGQEKRWLGCLTASTSQKGLFSCGCGSPICPLAARHCTSG